MPGFSLPVEVLRPPGEEDLQEIIVRSFTSFRLAREDTDRVVTEAADWLRRQENPGPILPLVSALLAELGVIGREQATAKGAQKEAEPSAPVTMEAVLDRLGERAWEETTRGIDAGWDTKLSRLLRQLVITRIGGGETRGLRNCPVDHSAVRAASDLGCILINDRQIS